jgi:hypothetical protein
MNDDIRFEILGPKLTLLEERIVGKSFLQELVDKKSIVKWGGAGVIIAMTGLDHESSDYVLVSPYANEIAWYFEEVKKILYESNVMDYLSKFTVFRRLAIIASEAPANSTAIEVLLLMQLGIKKMAISWDAFKSDA